MSDSLPKTKSSAPDPCAETCSGYGTQKSCPPLIVLANAAQDASQPAEADPCLASAIAARQIQKEPRS